MSFFNSQSNSFCLKAAILLLGTHAIFSSFQIVSTNSVYSVDVLLAFICTVSTESISYAIHECIQPMNTGCFCQSSFCTTIGTVHAQSTGTIPTIHTYLAPYNTFIALSEHYWWPNGHLKVNFTSEQIAQKHFKSNRKLHSFVTAYNLFTFSLKPVTFGYCRSSSGTA